MRMTLFFLMLFAGAALLAHPLHLSVTNITIENNEVKITMKTFRDDWEVAYFHYHSRVIDFSLSENRNMPWFKEYLKKSFNLSLKPSAHKMKIEVDSVIVNEDNMVIEMHCDIKEDPKSLYIYNTLLTDIFPDQTNLVIIGYNNRESGIKFDIRKHEEEISLK